jgi:acyl carrier protein phosphodiesterase
MNHLAHTLLAGHDDAMLLGGLLGDFWRGAPASDWPAGVAAGVRLHRRVDSYTDAHPVVVAAKARFDAPFRRYAGVVLDVWFDHLLARDFERLSGQSLRAFADRASQVLAADAAWWPLPFRVYAGRLRQHDGLIAYAEREHIGFVFERIAARLSRSNPVAIALAAVEAIEAPLARDFEAFWPDLVAFAERERNALAVRAD